MAAQDHDDGAVYGAVAGETEAFKQAVLATHKSICQVHASRPYSFDRDFVSCSTATGFYVDATLGLVLTNKHVAGPGPFWGNLIFGSNVEFALTMRYADPEGDFAILQVDQVEQVRALGIEEIKLAPEKAKPGVELRLLSNEVGTKLSMARAVLSRIDVTPPYGTGRRALKILNSPAYLASLGAAGGSSGGPALNQDGEAVALQVGTINNTSVNYLLPLHYPKLALQCLRSGVPIVRGTIQVKWDLKPLHECRPLGLSTAWEDKIRAAGVNHAIAVDVVLESGPAHDQLRVGDILLEVDEELYVDLFRLSRHLDERVSQDIRIKVWRGSKPVHLVCHVGDLHAITPHHLISRYGVSFHPLSWQVAVGYRTRVEGIYVTGYPMTLAFTSGMLLDSINDMPTQNMEQLADALENLGPGHCFITTVQRKLDDRMTPIVTTGFLPIDHSGRSVELRREPREGGGWELIKRWNPDQAKPVELAPSMEVSGLGVATTVSNTIPNDEHPQAVKDIFRSLFKIDWYSFAAVENRVCGRTDSWGMVFDVEQGYAIVPRYDAGLFTEVTVNFAHCVDATARIVFLNPLANFMLIQYDKTRLIKELNVAACRLCDRTLRTGDQVYYVSVQKNANSVAATKVESLGQTTISHSKAPGFQPFYHQTISLQSTSINKHSSGVVLLEDGTVAGIKVPWQYTTSQNQKDVSQITDCFVPASRIEAILSLQKEGRLDEIRWQDFDVSEVPLADAARRGVSKETLVAVNKHAPSKHQMLVVDKVPTHCYMEPNGEKKQHPLQKGDILLELDGKPVVEPVDLQYAFTQPSISLRVHRSMHELEINVPTVSAAQVQVEEVVQFCGATFQHPTTAIRARFHPCHSEVYLCNYTFGSPANIYGLRPQSFVTRLHGQEIGTMDDFKRAIANIPDQSDFAISLWENNRERLVSVKLNKVDWPSFSLSRDKPFEKGTWTQVHY